MSAIVSFFKNRKKLEYFKWYDIIVFTVIFCGSGIVNSTYAYIALMNRTADLTGNLTFTAADNWNALYSQGTMFALAVIYLIIRNFDIKAWKMRVDFKAIAFGVLIFAGAGLLLDLYRIATNPLIPYLPFPGSIEGFFNEGTLSTIAYAMFNGFYEEIFFLGICLSVEPKHLKWVVPFSILVRISFHTYQGIMSALGIGVVFGLYMYFVYEKTPSKNLVPFFIGHAIADVYGLALLWMFGIWY